MKLSFVKAFIIVSVGMLTSCGGGGSASTSVSDIQASELVFGQPGTITVSGVLLDAGITVSAQGCANLSQVTNPSAQPSAPQSSTSQTWTCVITKAGVGALNVEVATTSGTLLKAQSFDIALPTSPVVAAIEVDRLMYAKSSQFTITGYMLDKDIKINSRNCKGLALVAGGTSTQKVVTCKIGAVGKAAVGFDALLPDGTALKSKTFDVPAPQVTLVTNLGTAVIELDAVATPLTTTNFLQYVNDRFYDNTIIHRIVTSSIFVAQGGWLTPAPAVQSGQRAAISLEVGKGLSNVRGTIAMARAAEANSATSQYFFNLADNVALDTASGGYAVFGKLVSGLSLLDALAGISTSAQYGLSDFPSQSVTVQSASQTQ